MTIAERPKAEYIIGVRYQSKGGKGHNVEDTEISLQGPAGVTPDEIIEGVIEAAHGRTPAGWRLRITQWKGRDAKGYTQGELWNVVRAFAGEAEYDASAPERPVTDRDIADSEPNEE